MPHTRAELLAEAARRDREAAEVADRIKAGEPCLDSTLTYRRLQAQHLRRLAADAPEND
jgi:hypothetical protein